MSSCCGTDGVEMSARWFWGGCGWNELLAEPRDQKPRLGWLRCRIAGARSTAAQGDGTEETLRFRGKAWDVSMDSMCVFGPLFPHS